jgi:tetratricopeptide (TPR) repeat protein
VKLCRRPTWIPWSFHIVAATTLQYGKWVTNTTDGTGVDAKHDCLDALWSIRDAIPSVDLDAILQVENALHNVFISLKNWRMALYCLQRMIDLAPTLAQAETSHFSNTAFHGSNSDTFLSTLTAAYRSDFLSRQGRVLLQAGSLDQADRIFQLAATEWKNRGVDGPSRHDELLLQDYVVCHVTAQLSSNNGLLKFSYGKYEEALESFRTVVQQLRQLDRSPTGERVGAVKRHHPLEGLFNSLYSETINNMALCALYTCRLPEALQLMESLVQDDVTAHLTERVALNLCTMYELSLDSTASMRKKKVLQLVARRFCLQDIGVECFRVS